MKRNVIVLILGMIFVGFAAGLPTFNGVEKNSLFSQSRASRQPAALFFGSQEDKGPGPEKSSNPFEGLELKAEAAYVYDLARDGDKEIFSLNADASLPLASLTKLMTALIAKENIKDEAAVVISKEAVLQEGDEGFRVGESWPVSDLIDAMLISSSNDAAFALAESLAEGKEEFVRLMNKKAEEIGLTQTRFFNSTGLDLSETETGSFGSARDMAGLVSRILETHPSLFEITVEESAVINGREFKNTNRIINEIPRLILGKTGFSDLASGNLAVTADMGFNHPVVIVVLGSTEEGRFSDVRALYGAMTNF